MRNLKMKKKNKVTRFIGMSTVAVFTLSLLFFVSLQTAQAVVYGGIGGRPAYPRLDNPRTESIFVHTLKPGDIQKEGVHVVNNTNEKKTMFVYATDSTPSTGGAFACAQRSETPKDVGSWIKLKQTEVTAEAAKGKIVPFTITVPKNASVGEHNGCIVIQEKKKASKGSGAQLSFRTGLRVAITIPGKLERKLEIAGFTMTKKDDGSFQFHPLVKNLGNVSIDANVKVTTRYFFGLTHFENGGQYPILRGETSNWNFNLKKPFWGGWYRSSFSVKYDKNPEAGVGVESGKKLTNLKGPSIWFFSFPTPAGLAIEIIILLGLITIGALVFISQKRKRWIKENWVSYEVKPGEDIKSLSERFDVSWKLLAKTNKLEQPYALKPGQNIKTPPTAK